MPAWTELKRRNVFKVGAAYLALAWLLAQVSSWLAETLLLPDIAPRVVAFALILGFPLALFLAWAYEMTPDGVQRTARAPSEDHQPETSGRRLNYVIGIGFVAAAAVFVGNILDSDTAPQVSSGFESIAVLPVNNQLPSSDDARMIEGFNGELTYQLSGIEGLRTIAEAQMRTYAGAEMPLPRIAEELGVDVILATRVAFDGQDFRFTADLVDPVTSVALDSQQFRARDIRDLWGLLDEIQTFVLASSGIAGANEVSVRFADPPTASAEATRLYLQAQQSLGQLVDGEIPSIGLLEAAVRLDEDFALAWAMLSVAQGNAQFLMPARLREFQEASLESARKAIEIDESLPEAHAALGFALSHTGSLRDAQRAYDEALSLGMDMASGWTGYFNFKLSGGTLDEAMELAQLIRSRDPAANSGAFHAILDAMLGDVSSAIARADDVPGFPTRTLIRLATRNMGDWSDLNGDESILEAVRTNRSDPEQARLALRELYAGNFADSSAFERYQVLYWAMYFDDPELAINILSELTEPSHNQLFHAWWPGWAELRQHPRFKQLVREVGAVAYWDEYGWPERFCNPLDGGGFECY
jgi:TolB-like protein